MLRQVMTNPGEIEFIEAPIPEIADNEVLIKIMRIGICGSDIHVFHGKHPFASCPLTQGHESSGEIVKIGSNVKNLHIGQKITIEPQYFCGECHPCKHGKYNLCEHLKVMGFQALGTASQFFAVDASKATPIPDNMSFDEGAMIEPLAVTVNAARHYENVENCTAIVLGSGPIGILLGQTLKAMGAKKVMITDISDKRLELAKKCGIDVAVNKKTNDFAKAAFECFGEDKADVIFDCAGNDISMGQAISYARKGSKIVLVAVFADMAKVDLALLNNNEIMLDSSMMYRHEHYVEAIDLVANGKIDLTSLMSKHFPFTEFLDAYHYIEANKEATMKVLIDVN